MAEVSAEEWGEALTRPTLPQLDRLEREGVNIQCIESSDFVVGRQTNFNGPVTIISCADVLKQRPGMREDKELVIRDNVLSQSAAMKIQKMADAKEGPGGQELQEGQKKRHLERIAKLANRPKVSFFICSGLMAIAIVIGIAVFLATAPTEERGCFPLPNGACLYSRSTGESPEDPKPPGPALSLVVVFQTHAGFCYHYEECLKMREEYLAGETSKTRCGFLLGGEGNVYEAFGWGSDDSSASPNGTGTLRICFMGDFYDEEYPTYPQVVAAKTLIRFAVDSNFVSENYALTASNATSPGDSLASIYKIIKKWPNFIENPFSRR